MKRTIEYPITSFFVGEIYLYTKFGNLLKGETTNECEERLKSFQASGAINFQKDSLSRYIDWEETRKYTGFLTIFYKQDNKYICLHDGKVYHKNEATIIDNIIPLTDILPKLEKKYQPRISMYDALELFDNLFQEDLTAPIMYQEENKPITDFYVGDIVLQERNIGNRDERIRYIDLPHHLILQKAGLLQHSYEIENYLNSVYRCLFLKDGVDLYNVNNSKFYNPYEDDFETLIPLTEHLTKEEVICHSKSISIPKALRLFKKSI